MEGRGNWVMAIKEGMGCNEYWVFYATEESLNSTSEANNSVYAN